MLCLSWEGCKKSIMLKEKKLYICFVDLEEAFDRVQRKLLVWVIRKKN